MLARYVFCSACNRDIPLSTDDPHTCPVCLAPLGETAQRPADVPIASRRPMLVGPEIYLG